MSFKAIVSCDAFGCTAETELECHDPADAECAVFDLDGWFVHRCGGDSYYCPYHAEAARQELEENNPPKTGIRPTMVG